MDSIVIVALPEWGSNVEKISSEKVPHMTLLYLDGDTVDADLENVIQYVKHVADNTRPFGVTVDHRGELGADRADVLFFEDKFGHLDIPKKLRHDLLLNDTIKQAFDAADQFPNWTPHLTLGYPESPAKEDEDVPSVYYVSFDRIQVWTGDYDGPEFRLEGDRLMDTPGHIAMGEAFANTLTHYGVKGMKWGVRKADKASPVSVIREKKSVRKSDQAVTVSQRKPGTLVTTKGGKRNVASTDAVRTAAGRQKAKKSTLDSLSNDELKAMVERMNLETQFVALTKKSNRQTRGQRAVNLIMQTPAARRKAEELGIKLDS